MPDRAPTKATYQKAARQLRKWIRTHADTPRAPGMTLALNLQWQYRNGNLTPTWLRSVRDLLREVRAR